jgi:hypothetical protein
MMADYDCASTRDAGGYSRDNRDRRIERHDGHYSQHHQERPRQQRNQDRNHQEQVGDNGDMCNRLRNDRDAREVISNRCCERDEQDARYREYERRNFDRYDAYDGFPAIVSSIRAKACPAKFKLANIDKFDGKQDPGQWLHLYSTAVQAVGGNSNDKVNYFPVALTDGPLQWLQQLPRDTIDSWETLTKLFTGAFHGTWNKPPGLTELKTIKQNETIRSYNRRFFEMRATIINVTDKEVIEMYIDGLWSRTDRRELGHVHIPDGDALKDRAAQWADEEDRESNRKGGFVRTEGKKKDDHPQDQGNQNS